jgi:hypothetical protein
MILAILEKEKANEKEDERRMEKKEAENSNSNWELKKGRKRSGEGKVDHILHFCIILILHFFFEKRSSSKTLKSAKIPNPQKQKQNGGWWCD